MTARSWGRALRIPRPVVLRSALTASLLATPIVIAGLVHGTPAVLGTAAGVLSTLPAAILVPRAAAAGLVVPLALAAGVAVSVAGQPFPAAAYAALACLLIAPANATANGLLSTLPTVTAILTSLGADLDPWQTTAWVALGGWVTVAVIRRPPGARPPTGMATRSAWQHAAVMATLVGASVFAVTLWEVPHGYWVPLTLSSVLRPFPDQTQQVARDRSLATVVGALIALPLVAILPVWAVSIVAGLLIVATLGYTMLGKPGLATLASTPILVLVAGGAAGAASDIAGQRIAATVIGAALSVAAAVVLQRMDATTGSAAADGDESAAAAEDDRSADEEASGPGGTGTADDAANAPTGQEPFEPRSG